jgi:PAS domain S-box-containing protein
MTNPTVVEGRRPVRIVEQPSHPNRFEGWWRLFRARLHDRRFWIVQAMVVAVSGGHAATELSHVVDAPHLEAMYFVPASLYFFPILYASLNFGREGAIPTAVWSALLAIPNILLWHHGLERLGEAIQLTMMIVLASIVAWRVDKEVAARLIAETMERARALSEVKYRALFEKAAEPILVVSEDGAIQEANAAAAALLGTTTASLTGQPLASVVGQHSEAILSRAIAAPDDRHELHFEGPDGSDIWLEPLCTVVQADAGESLAQVMLKDVTERRGFQRYAREITRAQEEERQRIAQELHDVSVQSAIMICRRLDAATEAVEDGDRREMTRTLAEARRTAETMADELRRFSRDLRPLILDDLGLVPALNRLLSELRERSNLEIRFDVRGSVRRLDSPAELAMFRICQEALRNIELHADASRAAVDIEFAPAQVVLIVIDDGAGFVVPALAGLLGEGRLGLLGMRERAALVGGECEIQSSPGNGTRVVTEIPTANSPEGLAR